MKWINLYFSKLGTLPFGSPFAYVESRDQDVLIISIFAFLLSCSCSSESGVRSGLSFPYRIVRLVSYPILLRHLCGTIETTIKAFLS